MDENDMKFAKQVGKLLLAVFAFVVAAWGGCMYYQPHYKVYQQALEGEATLRKAESERMVQIEEAKGKQLAAKLLAEAEIERAKGVAEANRIIGESLANNESYLRYLWIQQLGTNNSDVIYVPTEAGLPILEANRLKPKQ